MNNEREILLHSVAAIINMQTTNDMFVPIMTSSGEVNSAIYLWLF